MDSTREQALVTWTQAIYALHAFSLLVGIVGVATVFGAFLTGWPSIIVDIINYVKRREVGGTWLESHFRWQIRTFWLPLVGVIVRPVRDPDPRHRHPRRVAALGIVSIWFIYRIARGWIALNNRRPMYRPSV